MNFLKQIPASLIEVHPAYVLGAEYKGIIFLPPNEDSHAESIGSQCHYCHNIIWVTGRDNAILNEPYPSFLDNETYRIYHINRIQRFFDALPPCPECLGHYYDLFITNIIIPRFQNGDKYDVKSLKPENAEKSFLAKDTLVWWYGSEKEWQRLNIYTNKNKNHH